MYDQKRQVEAWRLFITKGVIDEEVVRPEIARSWQRCRAAGVNPWSSDFPPMDERLLAEKQQTYAHSLSANMPIMRMLVALLNCNVSLMDQENFVFGFQSSLSFYPRTFGTFVLEEQVGTGNATIVPYEKRPVRVEGFEQYRAIAQSYSGVSAPYLDAHGGYFGALNFNDPFEMLPACALDMCAASVDLANELFLAGRGMWARLSTAEFFKPLVRLMDNPVAVLDARGRILIANDAMHPYLPRYETFSYGSQSLSAYLSKETGLEYVLDVDTAESEPPRVLFKDGRRKAQRPLFLLRRRTVELSNGTAFLVLVFDIPRDEGSSSAAAPAPKKRKVMGRASAKEVVDYVGESPEWGEVDRLVRKVAPIRTNVFLLGETGVGKEVVARALHRLSGRKGPFVAINCGAIPRDLFAAELFGYESGAFTGAKEGGALGKIEAANGGTLFLDEVGEMPLDLQVGLLRVIQEQAVMRLGSTEAHQLDVRFLAATNQNVRELVNSRAFRADLYYRLSVVEIELPPLRKRRGDVRLLAEYFCRELSDSLQLPDTPLSEDVLGALERYTWPGNVRELRNVVERALIMAGEGSAVGLDDLPAHVANAVTAGARFVGPAQSMVAALAEGRTGGDVLSAQAGPMDYDDFSAGASAGFPAGAVSAMSSALPASGPAPAAAGRAAESVSGIVPGASSAEPGPAMAGSAVGAGPLGGQAAAPASGAMFGAAPGAIPGTMPGMLSGPGDFPMDAGLDAKRVAEALQFADGDVFSAGEALGLSYGAMRARMAALRIKVRAIVEIEGPRD